MEETGAQSIDESPPPSSGIDRSMQADAYHYAIGQLMGRRVDEAMRDAMTEGHQDGPCGRVDCTAPQCVARTPAEPERLTVETIRREVRALRAAYINRRPAPFIPPPRIDFGYVTRDEFLRLYQQEWTPEELTPEQRVYQEHARRELEHREQQQRQAQQRAEGLLLEKLTSEQRETWVERRWVEVKGSRTRFTYRIKRGTAMNIDCTEAGYTYCAAPANAHETPVEDVILAQIFWITCDEDGFLAKANRMPLVNLSMPRIHIDDMVQDIRRRPWSTEAQLQRRATVATVQPTVPSVDRDGVETYAPGACVTHGCELRIDVDPVRYQHVVFHNGQVAMRIDRQVARNGMSLREIRRYLGRRLHPDER